MREERPPGGGRGQLKEREGRAPDASADPGKQRPLKLCLELDIPRLPVRKETGQPMLVVLLECDFMRNH